MSVSALIFVLVALFLACASIFKRPIFGLSLYVIVFFVSPAERWWAPGFVQNIRWSFVAAIITALSIFLRPTKVNRSPFWSRGPIIGLMIFTAWLCLQTLWAVNSEKQFELFTYYFKFLIAAWLIFRCIRTDDDAQVFLWSHFVGCLYLGWIAYSEYSGGRFEGFGGAGLSDANAGALALVTGVLVGAGLFIAGNLKQKAVASGLLPFILNGMVATVSRGAFLAMIAGGAVFNFLAPVVAKRLIHVLSLLGFVLMLLLTNESYWQRMMSIKKLGTEAQSSELGVDITDGGRRETMKAQIRMFGDHPLGCGHRCTNILSRYYLDDKYLTGEGELRGRSSHNTFMTSLVEHGIPGAILYVFMFCWLAVSALAIKRSAAQRPFNHFVFLQIALAVLIAIFAGDMFTDYNKFEIRYWFLAFALLFYPTSPRFV